MEAQKRSKFHKKSRSEFDFSILEWVVSRSALGK